jgi:hypothetical protein
LLAGCPDDGPPPGDCPGGGDRELEVSRRDDDAPVLVDGAELDVFPPPQGGTFTELDVVIVGLRADQIDELRVDVQRLDDGSPLSAQRYTGEAVEFGSLCQPDDTLLLQNLPVGFFDSVVLEELEGVAATLTVAATVGDDEVRFEVDVVLTVTSF